MTVSLPCRAHSGLHAGIDRWARSVLREFPISPPTPLLQSGEERVLSRRRDFHGNRKQASKQPNSQAAKQR